MQRRTFLYTAGAVAAVPALYLGGMALFGNRGTPARANDPWPPTIHDDDMVYGDPDAPVTMIEYASFTCGHCANFHNDTWPALRDEYVEDGRMKLVFRDFPLDGLALRAGMVARCAPSARYFGIVDVLFQRQNQWIQADDPVAELMAIGRMAGIGEDRLNACLNDEELADRLVALRQEGEELYDVSATPTFILEGDVMSGNQPIDNMRSAIDSHL